MQQEKQTQEIELGRKNYFIRIPKLNGLKYEKDIIKTWSFKKRSEDKISAVYFLFNDDKLIYVGQTIQLYARLNIHHKHINFTHYSYIPIKDMFRRQLTECYYIKKLKPPLNQQYSLRGWIR